VVCRSGCTVSQIFFFGFNTSSGSPSNPGNFNLSPTGAFSGGDTNSTCKNKYTCVSREGMRNKRSDYLKLYYSISKVLKQKVDKLEKNPHPDGILSMRKKK
jgi:hypothetical protein